MNHQNAVDARGRWDCIVVGGGAAGLSTALVLGRARCATLVIDAGDQSNLPAAAIGGLLGADGQPPGEFYERARASLERYPSVSFRDGSVADGSRDGDTFTLRTSAGEVESALAVVLATGMQYRPPELDGVEERWGGTVFHCPFCHGWEVREGALGVFGSGGEGTAKALLLTSWSDDVTLYTNGGEVSEERALRAARVKIDERRIDGLTGDGADLRGIRFQDGSEQRCDGLLVPVTMHQRSDLAIRLGASYTEVGPLTSEAVEADGRGATTVPGLFVAGDATGQMPSVANVVSSGSIAAAAVVQHLKVAAALS